jgi:predicted nucleotidyltransferase/transcriptional regulator with XRE-family HTH domain
MKIDPKKLRALLKSRGLTNTSLAAQAGITRQALQGLLRGDQLIEARDKTVKGLAWALRLTDESLLSPDPLATYKEAVADEHATLTFGGLGLPTTEPKSMDEVFIPIRLVRQPGRERGGDCQPLATQPEELVEEEVRVEEPAELTIAQCLQHHRHLLILGEPGSGKTTALRHAARSYARGALPEGGYPNHSRIPLMVRLADFARARESDGEMTLVRFVVIQTLRDASPEYWTQVERYLGLELEKGTCLVLLDGLDEVGDDTDLSTGLQRFINNFGQNQFVLSSRIVGLDTRPWQKLNFTRFQVSRWREKDIREFAWRWYGAQSMVGKKQKKQLEQRAEDLTTAILNHPPLRAIATNPLMLTILAALHHSCAALPRRRVDIYAKIVEVMLETWEAGKRGARPGEPLHGIVLEAREFGWLLDRLALGMQREGHVLRPRWWVTDSVQRFLQEELALDGNLVKEQSERVIRYLCERIGLLVERGDGLFGFGHRTFQEYFAAQGLLLEADDGSDIVALLRPHLFHPQWEEVVIYVAASLSPQRATTLLRIILDDPDPAGRFLRRGQLLALRCLADGATVGDRALFDQLFSEGEAIGRSRWLGITLGFISLLKQLLVTRHEGEGQRMLKVIEEAAKRDLPSCDYIVLYCSLHGLPDGPRDDTPGKVCRRRLGGRQVELVWPAWERRTKDPDSWYDEVLRLVRDSKTELKRRIVLISWLGEEVDANEAAQRTLKELLLRDKALQIRAECAEALQDAVSADSTIAKLIFDRLDKDKSDVVRTRCAEALRSVALSQAKVRTRLEELFTSGSELVRAGAVRGLSRLDFTSAENRDLLDHFLTTIASPTEPTGVRCACISAIAPLIGQDNIPSVNHLVEECLDDPDRRVSTVALHVLADAIAEERGEWSQPLVEKIEGMLMAVTDPCPHLFADLMMMVAMREMHGGRRLERLLGDALASLGDSIRLAFVFGSVARREQVQDSDIDLMIIGDVRLRDLAVALHTPEQTLGRTVNPVLYSSAKFREQYREGNPFLLDVYRKEKIFLKGSHDELTELVADRSRG